MDRGMYPTYFLHLDREDGKKVRLACTCSSAGGWPEVPGLGCDRKPQIQH